MRKKSLFFTLGKRWQDKVKDVRVELKKKQATAVVLQALDEIACKLIYNLMNEQRKTETYIQVGRQDRHTDRQAGSGRKQKD